MTECYTASIASSSRPCTRQIAFSSLEEIEAHYLHHHPDYENQYFLSLPWEKAILHAGHAVWYDERNTAHVFPHQYRVRKAVRSKWAAALEQSASALAKAGTFDELMLRLKEIRVFGVGEVFLYDTAARLAANRRFSPTSRVYLHAGTRVGARNLGLDIRREWIPLEDLHDFFPRLSPDQIEDVLCIYKNDLHGLRPRADSSS